MALYIAARASRGLITTPRNNSFDLVTIFIVFTAMEGCATALVTRAVAIAL
jgi:hypothetical protein